VSPERKPGDPGWKPSEEDIEAAQRPHAGLILRAVSVIPFIALGVVGVLALVAWAAVFIFGVGNSNGAVWTWAQGKPAGEVIWQVAVMLLIGVACLALTGLAIFATSYGVKPRQPWYFWPAAQTVFGILLILLVVGNRKYPAFMEDLGLSAGEFWFIFLWLAFSMVVAGLRMRRRGHDGADDSSG
jgi:hypothetical protein